MRSAAAPHLVRVLVELQVGERPARPAVGLAVRAAQHGADAGDELVEAERLRDVVVAAEREAADLVLDGVAGGQEEHRRAVAACAEQALLDLEAVEVGEHHVEHDEVGAEVLDARRAPRGRSSAVATSKPS